MLDGKGGAGRAPPEHLDHEPRAQRLLGGSRPRADAGPAIDVSRSTTHTPVLLTECLAHLALGPDRFVVDGTVGGGGHAEAILHETGPSGRLLGLDRDPDAIARASLRLAPFGDRVELVQASFRELGEILAQRGIDAVDGVLLDLGVSSDQLDTAERGFRFGADSADETPLDMRMDPRHETSAATLLASAKVDELARIFREYGELPGAARLARAIGDARRDAPLRTAADLVRVVEAARVGGGRKHHPATLVFQALRIAVNDELAALEEGLEAATAALAPGGRLCVLAYHSLEDRIVKRTIARLERGCVCPPKDPICRCGRVPQLRRITKRPVTPSDDEIRRNPRARSARLRAAERIAEAA